MINLYTNGTFSTVVNFAKNTAVFGTVSASFNFYGGTLQADPQINAVQGNNLLDANLPVFVYNGGAILDNNGKAMTINAALQNPGGSTGGLLLIGSGTTTLNGTNGLAGVTLVKQGTLALSSGFGSPSTIVVSNGATLGFNAGTLASNPNVTVADGGAIGSLLTSGGTAMTVSTLTLGTTSSGGIVNIQFGGGGNDSFTVSGTNGLTLNGGRINVYVEGTTSPFSTPGTYTIFNYSGTDAGSTNHLVVNNPADGATYAFNDTGSSIQLIIGVNSSLNQWGVDADGNWSQLSNWTLLIPNNSANSALFGSFITNPHTVTADANFTVKQIEFANNNSYTINGPGVITLSGSTNAVVDASIGSHVVNAGLALATNTLFSAAASQTITLAGNIAGSSSFQVSTNNLGTIAITGTNVAPVTVNAGSLTITGSGELTQPLTVLGGTAWIDGEANLGPNPPTLNTNQLLLNGGTLRSTGTASISNTNRGITLGTNGGSFGSASGVYTLTINNSIGGSGSLTKTFGSQGTVILAANNTYAGGTIVNYGDLQVGTGGTVGNLGTGANVTINNGSYLDLDRSDLTSLSNNFAIGTGGGCIRNLAAPSITLTGSFNDQTNNYLTLDTQGGNFIFPGDRVTNFYGVIETNGHSVTLTGNLTAGTTYGRIQVAGGTVAVASGANWTFTNNVTTRTIFVGAAGGLGGSMYVSNGAVLNVTGVSVGNANNSADSSFELDGGTVNLLGTAGDVVYLHEAGQSDNGYTMTVNSGTLNVPDPGSRFDIGFKGGATFTVNGGIVSLSRAGFGAVGSTITTSYALGGIGMNSAFIINGGSVNVSNQLELCSDQTANAGVYRVNTISVNSGGTLRTVAANLTTLAATPNIEFDLNGGTLVALGAGGYGGSLGNFLGGVGTVTVGPNSTINDGGYSMAITNALLDNGGGSLTKLGIGTLALNGANTYTGSTLVSNGTLGGNGSIAGSLSVSGGGTLSPGAGIGTFTVGGNAALSGETLMELNKTNAPTTNDLLVVTGTLTGGGTLIVTNLGPALVAGDTFKLFSKPVSGFTSISLPSGYNWTTNLASNGSITVQSVISSTPPTLSVTQTGSTLNFTWSDVSFHLQSQTNALNAGLSTNWSNYPGGGSSPVNITINPANPAVFFRLSQ
jgi:autotransporter-associated beta strand protein